MARGRPRKVRDWWPLRDAQCSMRGAGLSHVVDGTDQCVYCHRWTRERTTPATLRGSDEKDIPFTDGQVKALEFLQYLYREGKV